MLTEVAEGVLVHESEFIQSNSVVVQGSDGVLLIDPGITRLPGWDMSISALVAALMVLTGALRLRRQRRPNR